MPRLRSGMKEMMIIRELADCVLYLIEVDW